MCMTIDELKNAICELVEDNSRTEEDFKRLDKAGAQIVDCLDELKKYRAIGTVEQLEWCKDASHWKELFKEKLEQYEAIGTIEEFKALKEKNETLKTLYEDARKEGSNLIAKERTNAVDEFAKALHKKCDSMIKSTWNTGVAPVSWANAYADFKDDIDDVAEQMKAGGKNE